jgi:predicted small metal-binding protein
MGYSPAKRFLMEGQQGKYSFNCGDVMQGCSWEATADNKEELMAKVEKHEKRDHQITNIDPETREMVEGAIHKQAA